MKLIMMITATIITIMIIIIVIIIASWKFQESKSVISYLHLHTYAYYNVKQSLTYNIVCYSGDLLAILVTSILGAPLTFLGGNATLY